MVTIISVKNIVSNVSNVYERMPHFKQQYVLGKTFPQTMRIAFTIIQSNI